MPKDVTEWRDEAGGRLTPEMIRRSSKTIADEPANNGNAPPPFAKDLERDFPGTESGEKTSLAVSGADNDDSAPIRRIGDCKKARGSVGGAPVIILPSDSVELIDTAALLFRKLARTDRFFVKGGIIVELLEEKEIGKILHPLSPASLCSRIEEYFQVFVWRKHDGKPVLKQTTCPEETAKKLLFTTDARDTLNPIQTVIRCPVAVEDAHGEIKILRPGYHLENGGLLVVGGDVITVETTRDFANRAAFVRIPKRTGYRFKCYPEGDLLTHVKANQPYYLGCVFSVIREWLASGKPSNRDETRHDFREWAQVMDLLVTNLFGEAPLMENHLAAQERVSNPALNFVRLVCMAVMEDGRLGKKLTASDLTDIAETQHIELRTFRAHNS